MTAVDTAPGTNGIAGSNQTTIEIILSVGACALLLLILIFIGTATIHFLARERDALVASRPGATSASGHTCKLSHRTMAELPS